MRRVREILHSPGASRVRNLQTTSTPDNKASHVVFNSIARVLNAEIDRDVLFDKEEHFDGQQKSEVLWNIGPFKRSSLMPSLVSAA